MWSARAAFLGVCLLLVYGTDMLYCYGGGGADSEVGLGGVAKIEFSGLTRFGKSLLRKFF